MQQSIGKLSPSAARLLLAFLTRKPEDTFDEIMLVSGIERYQVFMKAKQELVTLGILTVQGDQLFLAQNELCKG